LKISETAKARPHVGVLPWSPAGVGSVLSDTLSDTGPLQAQAFGATRRSSRPPSKPPDMKKKNAL
jgi:hypothetical protein